jgi:hypothetical protein
LRRFYWNDLIKHTLLLFIRSFLQLLLNEARSMLITAELNNMTKNILTRQVNLALSTVEENHKLPSDSKCQCYPDWTGNRPRESYEGEDVRAQVYDDEHQLEAKRVAHGAWCVSPKSNVNGRSQGFDQRRWLEN